MVQSIGVAKEPWRGSTINRKVAAVSTMEAEDNSMSIVQVDSSNSCNTSERGSEGSDETPLVVSPTLSGSTGAVSMPEFPESPELPLESEGSFQWRFDNFSERKGPKELSPLFKVGNYNWRLLVYPRGNEPYEGQALSLYLAIDREENVSGSIIRDQSPSFTTDDDWAVCAQVFLGISNPEKGDIAVTKSTQHRFNAAEPDWGFSQFCSIRALLQGDASTQGVPLVAGNTLLITVRVRVVRDETGVLWHNFINYNSKKVTGYVGLANQGATCYMNSLLQTLFFTNAFRKALYRIPTQGEVPGESSALALQRIFWRLQYGDAPVSTQELTGAFGWDSLEAFVQSDVQEFSRVLMDELERRAKGTAAEGVIESLFVGKVRNVISCLNVNYASRRTESFYDLQLTIKDMQTLEQSFDNYVREEMLTGENQYHAEGFGLQDAKKYVEFEVLPPVLHLHLERYAFDPKVLATVKINDRLEFPRRINLDKYLAADSPHRGQSQDYILQSVFVHSGDSHGGHYYVFIRDPRPNRKVRWFRFDDTKVVPATDREAVEDTFGGTSNGNGGDGDCLEEGGGGGGLPLSTIGRRGRDRYRRFTNAYMLVYIREADLEQVLCDTSEADIPSHIGTSIRTEDEAERLRRAEKQEQLLTVRTHVITSRDLFDYTGFDFFNLDNRNQPPSPHQVFRIRRDEPIKQLKEHVASGLGIPASQLRLWTFALRRNKTIRLDESISDTDESKPVTFFCSRQSAQLTHFVLYAEELASLPAAIGASNQGVLATILFKFYDPERTVLKPVGTLHVRTNDTLESTYPQLRELVGLPRNVALEFYEEIKPGRIDPIPPHRTFSEAQLATGDIVCFQLAKPIILPQAVNMPTVVDYFRELSRTVRIQFQELGTGTLISDTRLSLGAPYSEIISAVSEKLGKPSSHIRLHSLDELGEVTVALKGLSSDATLEMVLHQAPTPVNASTEGIILACETTEIPVAELDAMKQIRICLAADFMTEAATIEATIYIGIEDTPTKLANRLPMEWREKLKEPIRLVETHNHRVIRDYIGEDSLAPISESSIVYVEGDIDGAELDPPPGSTMISVFNYAARDPSRVHSRPFRFLLLPGEPFHLTRSRLICRMGVSPLEAEKWTFSIVSYGRVKPINDEDVLAAIGLGSHDQIGIGRPDPLASNPIGSKTGPITSGIERSIKIRSSAKS